MDSAKVQKVFVFGDSFIDILASNVRKLPQWDEDCKTDSISLMPGGSALNTAVHLKTFLKGEEIKVGLHTALGDDSFASFLRSTLSTAGVIDNCACNKESKTAACIVFSSGEKRGFFSNIGSVGSMLIHQPLFLDLEKELYSYQKTDNLHLHIGGYFCFPQLHKDLPPFVERIQENTTANLTISFDPNYDETEKWEVGGLLPLVDLFTPNETEAMKIARTDSVQEACPILRKRMKKGSVLVVTLGEKGLCYCVNDWEKYPQMVSLSPLKGVTAIDATGAGDAFIGGFLSKYVQRQQNNLEDCLRFGSGSGALNVTKLGACNDLFSKEEVEEFIKSKQSLE